MYVTASAILTRFLVRAALLLLTRSRGHAFGGAGPHALGTFRATPGNVGARRARWARLRPLPPWEEGPRPDPRPRPPMSIASPPPGRGCCPRAPARANAGGGFLRPAVDGMLGGGSSPRRRSYHWELPQPLAAGRVAQRDMPGLVSRTTPARSCRIGAALVGAADQRGLCVGWLSAFRRGARARPARTSRARRARCIWAGSATGRAIEVIARARHVSNLGGCATSFGRPAPTRPRMWRPPSATCPYTASFWAGVSKGAYPARCCKDWSRICRRLAGRFQ